MSPASNYNKLSVLYIILFPRLLHFHSESHNAVIIPDFHMELLNHISKLGLDLAAVTQMHIVLK